MEILTIESLPKEILAYIFEYLEKLFWLFDARATNKWFLAAARACRVIPRNYYRLKVGSASFEQLCTMFPGSSNIFASVPSEFEWEHSERFLVHLSSLSFRDVKSLHNARLWKNLPTLMPYLHSIDFPLQCDLNKLLEDCPPPPLLHTIRFHGPGLVTLPASWLEPLRSIHFITRVDSTTVDFTSATSLQHLSLNLSMSHPRILLNTTCLTRLEIWGPDIPYSDDEASFDDEEIDSFLWDRLLGDGSKSSHLERILDVSTLKPLKTLELWNMEVVNVDVSSFAWLQLSSLTIAGFTYLLNPERLRSMTSLQNIKLDCTHFSDLSSEISESICCTCPTLCFERSFPEPLANRPSSAALPLLKFVNLQLSDFSLENPAFLSNLERLKLAYRVGPNEIDIIKNSPNLRRFSTNSCVWKTFCGLKIPQIETLALELNPSDEMDFSAIHFMVTTLDDIFPNLTELKFKNAVAQTATELSILLRSLIGRTNCDRSMWLRLQRIHINDLCFMVNGCWIDLPTPAGKFWPLFSVI